MSAINKKSLLSLSTFLVILILIMLGVIYIVDQKGKSPTLVGYSVLKSKSVEIRKIPEIAKDPNFNVYLTKIGNLEILSKNKQLEQVEVASQYLYYTYSDTNNHRLYELSLEFKKFVDANFSGKSFKIDSVSCLDKICAKQPAPNEILAIINEINNSSVSAGTKNSYTSLINNFMYIDDDQAERKVINYLSLADSIKLDGEFSKAGINLKIYNEIRDYINNRFPKIYEKYSNQVFISE